MWAHTSSHPSTLVSVEGVRWGVEHPLLVGVLTPSHLEPLKPFILTPRKRGGQAGMSTRRGLVVIAGGMSSRDGRYMVASEVMIMSMIGLLQLAEPKGVSLNRLQHTLDRVREGKPMVDWYELRASLTYLENDGRLKSEEVRGRSRLSNGLSSYRRWRLADWEEWWRLHRGLLL